MGHPASLSRVGAVPRALSDVERAVLDFLLGVDFPGASELRIQARHVVVTARCECGCPTFELAVDQPLAVRANVAEPIPVEARSSSDDHLNELLLFVKDGWLASVELVHYSTEPPSTFPPLGGFDAPVARAT